MNKSVYIDTTIRSYYFDERDSISFQNQITKKWFSEESQNFDIFISEAVLIELQEGSYPNKKQHIRIINTRLNLMVPEIITPLELFTETAEKEE